jgi:hypothetical protein
MKIIKKVALTIIITKAHLIVGVTVLAVLTKSVL